MAVTAPASIPPRTGASRFQPYTGNPSSVSPRVWRFARWLGLAATLAMTALVLIDPARGMMLFWQLAMPALPLLFAVAPGLWRQVCPMAFVNQLPVERGWSRGATLPVAWQDHAYLAAVGLFALTLAARGPLLSVSAPLTAALIVAALASALAGGLLFKGRSGWCGTFCPLGPIQKVYGHAPPVVVANGYCPTCIGCQKNCYDFNPNAALHADLAELPPRLAEHRTLFAGLLPGLVLGAWLADPYGVHGPARYLMEFGGYCLGSLGALHAARSLLGLSPYRLTALFGMAAFVLFYWFEAAPMAGAVSALTGVQLPYPATFWTILAAATAVAARVLWTGLDNERAYARERAGQAGTTIAVEPVALAEGRRVAAREAIRERSSGRTFGIDPGKTLLEALESGGMIVTYGCRSGVCGADPIAITAGQDNLSAPDANESATLRRLGLEGRARMACVCRATGPVEVDLGANLQALVATPGMEAVTGGGAGPAVADRALDAGIRRVVIVGNGVAGTTAAGLIRDASPSCRIDIISRESHHFYNRMALGRVVTSRSGLDGLQLMPGGWFERRQITVWLNTIAQAIDPDRRVVRLGTGETLPYDRLILATGGAANWPDAAGARLPGVFVLREAEDALRLRAWSQQASCREAMVVGGGVLGIEAAAALVELGLRVTLVHAGRHLMDRHLDARGAAILERFLMGKGIEVLTATQLERLIGGDRLEGAQLADGTRIEAQMCVFCVGLTPNIDLARAAGLKTGTGIVVDAGMATSRPEILAIGDAAQGPGAAPGLWTLGAEQAEMAVAAMLGRPAAPAAANHVIHLKVSGIDVRAFGRTDAMGPHQSEQTDPSSSDNEHRKIILENGRVAGAVLVGPPGTAKSFAAMIEVPSSPV